MPHFVAHGSTFYRKDFMDPVAADIQKKLNTATNYLVQTQTSGVNFVLAHGKDWTKWPKNSPWYIAFNAIYAARKEAGVLVVPHLTADFSVK